MPICSHDDVRGVHKQAYSLSNAGYEVVLLVRQTAVKDYLGMAVVSARAPFRSLLRPILNLPFLLRQSLNLNGDLYIVKNPDTLALALLLRLLGRKVIYDTQEDFSKRPLIKDRLPRPVQRAVAVSITLLERLLSRTVNAVIVTQRQQPEYLGGRTVLQPNAPLISGPVYRASRSRRDSKPDDRIAMIYAGAITERRGLWPMLDLVARMNETIDASLELLGRFESDALFDTARQHRGWRYVNYRGMLPHAEALSSMRRAHIGLAILQPVADYPSSSINKLYEYMEAGLPFVASDFPAWRVETSKGPPGIYIDPTSQDELYVAAKELAGDAALRWRMGMAGRDYVIREFNWDLLADSFVDLVGDAAGMNAAMTRSEG